jgi:hypothetical protein
MQMKDGVDGLYADEFGDGGGREAVTVGYGG